MTGPSSAPSLNVSKLSVTYGDFQALINLSLTIETGDLVGVIGPNGAGKTSFIKALCGRVPSTGQISISGQRLKRGQDRRHKIGLVPQDIGLYPTLTARENLDVMARLLEVSPKFRRNGIDQALDAVGMSAKSDTLVQNLSGGMKRRINVAAAIMHEPDLVIFDEPTAGVDIPARDILHRLARNLADSGKAVILVTHDLDQAETLCDKVLLLSQGEKLAYDTPFAILSRQFGESRNVVIRFSTPPSPKTLKVMQSFDFSPGERPGIWTASTREDEPAFLSGFMESMKENQENIREISVLRPGLTALMHHVETHKGLTS